MKNLIRNTLIVAGFASGLGIVAGAFAEADSSAAPPPAPPASTAPADGHGGQTFQPKGDWRGRPRLAIRRNRMRRLARFLQLDKTQRMALRHVHAKAMADIWSARADEGLTPEQRSVRIKAAVEAGRTEFRNLLTPDQRAKLEQIENRREQRLLGL
jgi:Spy/CpxP family protein refolding chaperone